MLKRMSAPLSALALAGLVVASAGTGAVAQRLVDSKDVADNSLTGRDIKDSSLTGKDIKKGSLTAANIKGGVPEGVQGPQGVPGPQGATGPAGPEGKPAPSEAEFYRLEIRFVADGRSRSPEYGSQALIHTSSDLPAYSRIEAGDMQVEGDFSSCLGVEVTLIGAGGGSLIERQQSAIFSPTLDLVGAGGYLQTFETGRPVRLLARCGDAGGGSGLVPSFNATIILRVTPMAGPVTRNIA